MTMSPVRIAILLGLRAWSRMPALRPSKVSPQDNQRRTVARVLRIPNLPPSAALQPPCKRIVGEDDHGAAAVTSPPSATPPPLSPQSPASKNVLEEQEWEISKIIGKRRAGRDCEYKVRWRSTWLPRSELGSAQQLLQEFEAQLRAEPNFSFKTRILL